MMKKGKRQGMRHLTIRAPAKVNLSLHVLRQRPDGYHELDSLTAFVPEVADRVTLSRAPTSGGSSLEVIGPFADAVPADESNLALRAANMMIRRWPALFGPVRIRLEKNLPAAAGIGGGSADAAAVLRGMCRLFGALPPRKELLDLALRLGADVPVCLRGRATRMLGKGEVLRPASLPEGLPVLLCNPGVAVSTAEVFRRLARRRAELGITRAPGMAWRVEECADSRRFLSFLARQRNDLQMPACELAPEIGACLQALRKLPGVRLARMSGSGATCLALFEQADAADAAARLLRNVRPRWWVATGRLR